MKPASTVLNNIKELRKVKKLSLDALADAIGVRKSTVWNLEQGLSYPQLDNAYKMAKVLNVGVYDVWPVTFEMIEETITIHRIVIK
jgi:transcriptional regulator with XRE-family HTH domain